MFPRRNRPDLASPVNRKGFRWAGLLFGPAFAALLMGCGPSGASTGQGPARDQPPSPNNVQQPSPAHPAPPLVAKPFQIKPGLFKRVLATDGTFSLIVPGDWTVKTANWQAGPNNGLAVWSPRGEMIFEHVLAMNGSPPQSPVEAVRDFYPQIYAPLVQKVRILDSQDLPLPPEFAGPLFAGAKATAVHYQYTLAKGKDANPPVLALFPPALTSQEEVVMEGWAQVRLIPGFQIGTQHPWQLSTLGYEAPADLWRKNQILYDFSFRSFRENKRGVMGLTQQGMAQIQGIAQMYLDAGANAQMKMNATSEFFNYMAAGEGLYYSEADRQVYAVSSADLTPGGIVQGPDGQPLRPASADDLDTIFQMIDSGLR